ncbi:MAG: PQQ-dependent sugar dehydrogenase [Polymorphobacter sp.]|uniref:PQQ-dependent sugar dehydrogenase n=1 Tax=Polymorphobacter sp. TaxID=1909290 RepID=UPI003A856E9F
MLRFLMLALLWAGGATAQQVEVKATGLNHPWSLAFLPDGAVLVTERNGRLKRIAPDGRLTEISGVPAVFHESQAGLFDVVLHPRFAENQTLFLSFAKGDFKANATAIVRARLEGNRLTGVREIFVNAPMKAGPVHFGGRMVALGDGSLVMSTGDGFDYREQAQVKASGLGKIVRIGGDGSIPADNPFERSPVWSWGHRNPQGLALDAETGTLWAHEHGPRGGDEVNRIEKGRNYGWPVATRGLDYSGATISPFQSYPGMEEPRVVWVPSIAPSGLAVYRGDMFPEWQGSLIVGALASEELRLVTLDAGGRLTAQARIVPEIDVRVRDVRVAPDGAVWVTTDEPEGRVLRVSKAP